MLEELQGHCVKRAMPPEVQRLGRTIQPVVRQDLQLPPGQGDQRAHRVAQQPDQAHQTVGFGFRNFRNYRIRALLYAGKPNWRVLGSIVVR